MTPIKMIIMYVFAISSVPSSGTCISRSSGSLKKTPIRVSGTTPTSSAI